MKALRGIVTKTKMAKTATVMVERKKIHPIYKKGVKVTKKYHAHDEIGVKVGDKVKMVETRPISKTKTWKIVEVVK
jgi:small subunit ribosomal protein S17